MKTTMTAPTRSEHRTTTGPVRRACFVVAAVVMLTTITLSPAGPAHACSCIAPAPPRDSLADADAVFSGTVTFVEEQRGLVRSSADPVIVRFSVDGVWKGEIDAEQEIVTAASTASCGFPFEEGGRYLVYAGGTTRGLSASLCSRTAPFPGAEADLAVLGSPLAPRAGTPPPGSSPWQLGLTVIAAGAYVGLVAAYHRRQR